MTALTVLNVKEVVCEKLQELFANGCQRVLFVVPPNVPKEDFTIDVALNKRYPVYPPVGYGILCRDIENRGYATDILDLNYLLQIELEDKKENFVYDIWQEWLRARVEEFKPDLIGLTCMFTIYHRSMKRISQFVKEEIAPIPIIAGGVHTTSATLQERNLVLKDCPHIDMISLYEGNKSFADMLDVINGYKEPEALTQLSTHVDGRYVTITERAEKPQESLDLIPHYHNLPIGEYSAHGRIGTYYWKHPSGTRAATALSNVGCRAQCTFCSVRSFNGKGVYGRSISSVVDELEMLRDRYGITHIMWLDDDLLYDEKRAIALFNEMRNRKLGITWDATNGIIASAMTEEIAAAAAESGCIGISIGIESGSEVILKSVKKPSMVKHFIKCSGILKKYPQIFVRGLLMCGFPNETIGMVWDTIALSDRISLDWNSIQPLNFIPGVELTNHALQQGLLNEQELIDGTERPFLGSTGGVQKHVAQSHTFVNPLESDHNRIPDRSEIPDIWFVMDYMISYRRIEHENNPIKLEMLQKLFVNMCDKTHKNNALGNLYFAIIEQKIGNPEAARFRLSLAREYSGSDYWRPRFEALGLFGLLGRMEQETMQ